MSEHLDCFKGKNFTFGVVGLGYVGLPLAVEVGRAGIRTLGLDVSVPVVEGVNAGRSHIQDVPSDAVADLRAAGRLEATADPGRLAECDVIAVCVPTPLSKTRDPDISYVLEAGKMVAANLRPGQLIVLESTTYPGTTRDVLLPLLERAGEELGAAADPGPTATDPGKAATDPGPTATDPGEAATDPGDRAVPGQPATAPGDAATSGQPATPGPLKVGRDYFLCFSPERVDPGNAVWKTKNTPKVMGGLTPACLEAGTAAYAHFIDTVVPVSSPETAELTKLLENTFRAVNIALVNETAQVADRLRVDIWEVIEAAATKPFGFMKFTPGPGLGGHCIPIDPHYLSWKMRTLDYRTRFIELASEVNAEMPAFVVGKVQEALNMARKAVNGSRILVLGVAYKPDIDDVRESPALDIMNRLERLGARVEYHDSHVPQVREDAHTRTSVELTDQALEAADCVVIVTDHSEFDLERIFDRAHILVDSRNATGRIARERGRGHPQRWIVKGGRLSETLGGDPLSAAAATTEVG